jgi:putative nonproteinogenic amino acid hydroxylase
MESRPLARVRLAPELVGREVDRILCSRPRDEYSEYTFGTWRSYALWNGSGDSADTTFRSYQGVAQPTDLGQQMPCLNELIAGTFALDRLRWVRAFLMHNGLLISHRDFVEQEVPFTRLNLPLRTEPSCLHSEEDDVFHMRRGEIWFLSATRVHAACCLSDFSRVSLCFDFEGACDDPGELIRGGGPGIAPRPLVVDRPPMTGEFLAAILGLGAAFSRENWREMLSFLGRIHFYKRAHAAAVFDWLAELARRSRQEALIERAVAFKRFCIEDRRIGERFTLPPAATAPAATAPDIER